MIDVFCIEFMNLFLFVVLVVLLLLMFGVVGVCMVYCCV